MKGHRKGGGWELRDGDGGTETEQYDYMNLRFYNYAPLIHTLVTVQFNISCFLSHHEVP